MMCLATDSAKPLCLAKIVVLVPCIARLLVFVLWLPQPRVWAEQAPLIRNTSVSHSGSLIAKHWKSTRTFALSAAINKMAGDLQGGSSDPLPTLCAAGGDVLCRTAGSASIAHLAGNGSSDDTGALQAALSKGDVNLTGHRTYVIRGTVAMPSFRTLQCQPGAILRSDSHAARGAMLSLSNSSHSTIIGCYFDGALLTSRTYAPHAVLISSGSYNMLLGNAFVNFPAASAVVLSHGTAAAVVVMNDFENNSHLALDDHDSIDTNARLNRINGRLEPAIPFTRQAGGTQLQRNLWKVLTILQGSPGLTDYQTIAPGAVFQAHRCHGNGVSDDTACLQSAFNAGGSVLIKAGTYAIRGSVKLGSNQNLLCERGAKLLNTTEANHVMLDIGTNSKADGNNIILGCELAGIDNIGKFANTYSEFIEVASNHSNPSNVLIAGNSFSNGAGDNVITYSPCGPANLKACGGRDPANSGPHNIAILFNNFNFAVAQSATHLNGGQRLNVAFNRYRDANATDEADANVRQIITASWRHNYAIADQPQWDSINKTLQSYSIGCSGRGGINADYTGCAMLNSVFTGNGGGEHPMEFDAWTHSTNCGRYQNNHLAHSAKRAQGGC